MGWGQMGLSLVHGVRTNGAFTHTWGGDKWGFHSYMGLSPELFKIFLSDLHEYLSKEVGIELSATIIFYILYADDLILIADSDEGLQRLLDVLFSFGKKMAYDCKFDKN